MRAPGSQVSAAIFSKDLLCVTLLDRGVSAAHSARSGSRLGRKRRPAPRGRRELGARGRESAPRPTGTGQRAVLLPAGAKRPAPAAPGPGEGGGLDLPLPSGRRGPERWLHHPPSPAWLCAEAGRGDPAPQASALPAPGRGGRQGWGRPAVPTPGTLSSCRPARRPQRLPRASHTQHWAHRCLRVPPAQGGRQPFPTPPPPLFPTAFGPRAPSEGPGAASVQGNGTGQQAAAGDRVPRS